MVLLASYESILSQISSHSDIAQKLHNDAVYPTFESLKHLLSHPDQDPVGIRNQFEEFLSANVTYPIVLVRSDTFSNMDALKKFGLVISKLLGDSYDFTSLYREDDKSSSLDSISDPELRTRFVERYQDLNELFKSQPLIRLLEPKN